MNEKDPNIQGNKISRLQFLRLLGAGVIGYFAYRAGFINSLFGNATAAAADATTSKVKHSDFCHLFLRL
jgi:hypothetical protein